MNEHPLTRAWKTKEEIVRQLDLRAVQAMREMSALGCFQTETAIESERVAN
jgi:hypothetical protein